MSSASLLEKASSKKFNNLSLASVVHSWLLGISMGTTAIWPTWQRLYPLYGAIAREWVIEWQPCAPLDPPIDSPADEAIAETRQWFARMDRHLEVQHLRQFAQTSPLVTEAALKDFLDHHVHKQPHSDPDRDKVDFLVVQLFAEKAPPQSSDADLSLRAVAKILEPVLGPQEAGGPALLEPLDDLIQEAGRTKTLKALFTSRVIERGREVKAKCGERFFDPSSLAALARFGFLIRRTFFRLMHQDLHAILDGLDELEANDIRALDCRKAQFAAAEPIARLRMLCHSWRVMFQAEYASGRPLCLLVDLRTAVESALENMRVGRAKAPSAAAAAAALGRSDPAKFSPIGARSASFANPKPVRPK